MLQRDLERISEIVGLLAAGFSYTEIGELQGITRQRVQQIVKPSKDILQIVKEQVGQLCEACHKAIGCHIHHKSWTLDSYNNPDNLLLLCSRCHRHLHSQVHYCIVCGTTILGARRYCSNACKVKQHTASYKCEQCSILFTVRRSGRPRRYCSKQCFGKWLGCHHGGTSGIGSRKWDEDTLIALHNIGYTRRMISLSLHMPFNTVKFYLTRYRKEHQKHTIKCHNPLAFSPTIC